MVVGGTPRPLKPLVRDEVYRIAAEALRNATRHANARHVTAEIRCEGRQFRLIVRDGGVGVDEQTLREGPAGHFGPSGMRERAAVVGARLEILTRPDLGTVLELSSPGAYAASRRPPIAAASTTPGPPEQEVEIHYGDGEFRLRVRDDGKGIDAAVLARQGLEGHYGLRGMPERAGLIGGKLRVWSEVDAGTEVELRVPGRAAYATVQAGSRLSRLAAKIGMHMGSRS